MSSCCLVKVIKAILISFLLLSLSAVKVAIVTTTKESVQDLSISCGSSVVFNWPHLENLIISMIYLYAFALCMERVIVLDRIRILPDYEL